MTSQYQQDGPVAGRPVPRGRSKRLRARPVAAVLAIGLTALGGAFAGSASAAVPGLQRITATSVTNSVSTKTVTAVCPVGKRVTGAGGDITGGLGQVVIDDLAPTATSVRVTGYEDDTGTTVNWSVRAYAICANPLPGQQIVTASAVSNSVSGTGVTATCPVGKRLIGTGGELTGATGQVVMDDITPSSTLSSVRVTGFEDDNGTAANWSVRAYAVCAYPLAGLSRVTATSASNSLTAKSTTANCPVGRKLTGTGGDFTGGVGQVVMDDITPNSILSGLTITGREDENGTTASWFTHAYAICAAP